MGVQKKLEEVGNEGRYQVFTNVFSALLWVATSITIFIPSYLFITPTFTCSGVTDIKQVEACPKISTCIIDQIHTVTASANLYCDYLYIRNSILSAQFIGSIAGLLILSPLSDHFGRKKVIILSLIIDIVGSTFLTIGSKLAILQLIYIGIAMVGLASYSLPLLVVTYLSQVCSETWKSRGLIIGYAFWTVGQILLYPIIVYIKDFVYIFCFIYILPLVILLLLTSFLIESPEFLNYKKRHEECKASLNYIARFNGKPELNHFQLPLQNNGSQGIPLKQDSKTFFSCQYMVPLALLCLGQFCASGFYYIIQFSMDEYGYRFEFNMLLVGCLEFVSCFIANFIAPRLRRKPTIIILLLVPATAGIINQFISSQLADFIILGFIRFFLTVSFTILCIIAVQTFPSEIRSRGLGIPEMSAMVGNVVAPFVVALAANLNIKILLIGGIMIAFAGFAMFFIKETKIEETQQPSQDQINQQQRKSAKVVDSTTKFQQSENHILS